MKKLIAAGVFLTMACIIAGRANAASVRTIETSSSGAAYTLDNASGQYPVVTQILSQPGTVNGLTYTNWAFFANEGTGSIDVFGKMPTGSTYTPTVGDAITATGTYSPFDQIPELATLTAITKTSSGNVVPAPTVTTIPTINVAPTLPFNVAGYMLEVDNVTISGEGNAGAAFGKTNSPTGALITDGNENSMTLFYWPTSYSVANANMFGRTIPTVPVSMTGFVDFFASVGHAEFSPITITAPPALWQPASGSSNWDGTTLSWSTSAGPVADVSFSTATFDDSGLANGSTVNITSGTSAALCGRDYGIEFGRRLRLFRRHGRRRAAGQNRQRHAAGQQCAANAGDCYRRHPRRRGTIGRGDGRQRRYADRWRTRLRRRPALDQRQRQFLGRRGLSLDARFFTTGQQQRNGGHELELVGHIGRKPELRRRRRALAELRQFR